jgi:autotransporter-associated beta strand protein
MSGTGLLTKSGTETLELTGTSTYSGGTIVSEGILRGSATSLQGAINNNAAVVFNQTTTSTYAGIMSGSGSLTKSGTGTLELTGSNTYSGDTLVSAGILRGNATSLQGAITNYASVAFNQTTNGTYASIMAGTGSLTKSGTGTLTLSNINTFSGSTTVQEGRLQLANDSALASSRIVPLAGGTLTMSPGLQATVGGLAANAGGLIDVGNGLMTVVAGLPAADMLTALLAGRGDGSWNGSSGITSSAAAAALSVSTPRTVGWLDNGDRSVTFAFAAPGDTNLDWTVDFLDLANFLGANKFDSGDPATWKQGDFGYDGVVDILDVASFTSSDLLDAGPYNPPAGTAAGIAAVPEPSLGATVVFVAVATSWFVRRRMVGQIRGAKFSGDVSKA